MSAFISYDTFQPPDAKAWLGTDVLGRDVLSRLLAGARVTLLTGISAAVLAHVVGDTRGMSVGVRGGWLDCVFCRMVDVVFSSSTCIGGMGGVGDLGAFINLL